MSTPALDPHSLRDALQQSNRFLVQQVFRPIGNEYRISAPPEGDEEGTPLLYVKQKKLAIKEDIRFRTSPDDSAPPAFMIKAKSVFEFRGRHDVLDELGAKIGLLEKVFGKSLLRSHWVVRNELDEEVLEAHEASWPLAILRRIAEFGPDWIAWAEWIPFNFVLKRDGQEVGTYRRVFGKLRDRYVLELGDALDDVDRRLVLAFAVALDSLQDR